jgi:hypothetical protein
MLAGCDALEPGGALLYVFSTHHATPEDGKFPDRGADLQPRIFDNDMGWQVTLLESYITIDSITIAGCDGHGYPLNMFWGPCPEDLRGEDLETLTVAGRKLPPGDYCGLQVTYGPYSKPVIDDDADTRHAVPQSPDVDGTTVYFRGGASTPETIETPVEFELHTAAKRVLVLDLSEAENGHPVRIGHHEDFPKELTISKTYDRFFDGIDFGAFDEQGLEGDLEDILADETRVQEGTTVLID